MDVFSPCWNSRLWTKTGNHYQVAILPKDGLYELEQGLNNGDAGDMWLPGDVLGPGMGGTVYPNTDRYQGGTIVETGLWLKVLSQEGTDITFQVGGFDGEPVPESGTLTPETTTTTDSPTAATTTLAPTLATVTSSPTQAMTAATASPTTMATVATSAPTIMATVATSAPTVGQTTTEPTVSVPVTSLPTSMGTTMLPASTVAPTVAQQQGLPTAPTVSYLDQFSPFSQTPRPYLSNFESSSKAPETSQGSFLSSFESAQTLRGSPTEEKGFISMAFHALTGTAETFPTRQSNQVGHTSHFRNRTGGVTSSGMAEGTPNSDEASLGDLPGWSKVASRAVPRATTLPCLAASIVVIAASFI